MNAPAPAPAPAHAPGPPLLECPRCARPPARLKHVRLRQVGRYGRRAWYVRRGGAGACPRCMRRRLLVTALLNTVPMNVLWPIAAPLAYGIPLLLTFRKGHSKVVRRAAGV